jgi:hypothetical protein
MVLRSFFYRWRRMNMTYKRTLLFTIITLLALLLWGCGGAATPAAQEEGDTGAAAPAEAPAEEAEAEGRRTG